MNRLFMFVVGLAIFLLLVVFVMFNLLREQGKVIAEKEATNDRLQKELVAVNRRIVLFTRAREQGRQFRIEVDDENEKNGDWAGDAVPVSVINRLCTKINCADTTGEVQSSTGENKNQR